MMTTLESASYVTDFDVIDDNQSEPEGNWPAAIVSLLNNVILHSYIRETET